VEDAIAAADAAAAVRDQVQHQQQQQQQRSFTRSGSSSSSSDEEDLAVLLTSAADKLYKQRLRELHALMSAEGLQQLRLTPQQYDSLQVSCCAKRMYAWWCCVVNMLMSLCGGIL